MRPTIGSPDFIYKPMSEERRAKLREVHRKRLGNKPGHHRLYDVQVPDKILPDVRRLIAPMVRNGVDMVTVGIIIRLLIQRRWLLADPKARFRIGAALVR